MQCLLTHICIGDGQFLSDGYLKKLAGVGSDACMIGYLIISFCRVFLSSMYWYVIKCCRSDRWDSAWC